MSYLNFDKLQKLLEKHTDLCYFNGSKTELITRCPKCEQESIKQHGHLYIDTRSPVFNCFRCDFKGFISKLLTEFKISKEDVDLDLDSISFENVERTTPNIVEVKKYDIDKDQFDKYKLKKQYMMGRLHHDLDLDKIPNLIFDFKTFLKENNIYHKKDDTMIEYLESSFVGFLGNRGQAIFCRNINSSENIQHYKLSIWNEKSDYVDFYGAWINDKLKDNNTIVLCEGAFDLLNIVSNRDLHHILSKCCFIASIANKYYYSAFDSVLDYCKLVSANLIIFGDSDTNQKDYKNLKHHPFINDLKIYINKHGKDFGEKNAQPVRTSFSNFDFRKK